MFYVIWTTLALIQFAHTEENPPFSFICEDDIIMAIAADLKAVKLINEGMQSKLDAFNKSTNQQLEDLKKAELINQQLEDLKNAELINRQLEDFKKAQLINQQLDDIKKAVAELHIHITSSSASNASNVSAFSNSLPNVCQSGRSGMQWIQIQNSKLNPFLVNCIKDAQQGDSWILIQRRRDGSVDFYRNWSDYQQGFGNLEGEFFIGLDKLHALTKSALYELWIKMETFTNVTLWARYSNFTIGDESQSYALNTLGNFSGNGGDSLTYHVGMKFTTKDNDNDLVDTNCALRYYGGWWYDRCYMSNLNGIYLPGEYTKQEGTQSITWNSWLKYNALKYVHMAIRPVKLS